MMVVITSCAPVCALRNPGMNPQIPPAIIPARTASGRWTKIGRPGSHAAASPAHSPPTTICPSMPMLNSPARAATAKASPPRISGVAATSVSASSRWPPNAPAKRAWNAGIGFAPERASTMPPAINAMATASNEEKAVGSAPAIRCQREGAPRSVGGGSVLIQTPAPHQQTQLRPCHRAIQEVPDDAALAEHQNTVAEIHHLVEIEGDEEDAAALVTLRDKLLVDKLDGSHVETTSRLDGKEGIWLAMQFAGDDQLLLVSSRECPGRSVRGWSANVEGSHQPFGQCAAARVVDPTAGAEWCLLGVAQEHVLGERKGKHQPPSLAVLRDVGESHAAARVRASRGDVLALQQHPPALRTAQPGEHLDQFSLSITLDAADTKNLATTKFNVHPIERGMPLAPLEVEILRNEHRLARVRRWAVNTQRHGATNH